VIKGIIPATNTDYKNGSTPASKSSTKSFTLIELIIVVIIIGILASLGLNQYNLVVEKSRTAEAKVRIGVMRNIAYTYYLEHGTFVGMSNVDVGVDYTCTSTDFYRYFVNNFGTFVELMAVRCTSDGKAPNASSEYQYYLSYYPDTGQSAWHCHNADASSCFGLPY
jgi:prepilin-type N-terminal cleavage/methylation domain-containing protein